MFLRFVSCIAIGIVVAIFAVSVIPCVALDDVSAPALTGPANASDPQAKPTEAELSRELEEAGVIAEEEGEQAIHHPLAGESHAAEKEGHDGHKPNDNPLEWKADLAMWTGVVFLVVFGLLYKFAWGPITEGLDKRENGIADNIAAANKSNEEARALLDEYQARLDTAEGEVKAMLDKARADASRTGEKIVEAAKEAAEAEQKRALAEIDQATAGALGELAAKSADLAVSLAGKIVKSELKASDHATLVSEAVSNFGKPK